MARNENKADKIESEKTCKMCRYFGDAAEYRDYENKPILFRCIVDGKCKMKHWKACGSFRY